MKIKKVDYYGLDHEKIVKAYEGDLTFVNYMCVKANERGDYVTAAVYKAANPNREKGHKDYMLIYGVVDPVLFRTQYYVSGKNVKDMKKESRTDAVLCLECDTVLYSLNRHHYHKCECKNETMIDGGKDYIRYGGKSLKKIKLVSLDVLTDKVKVLDKSSKT